jgi:hypothetical protein
MFEHFTIGASAHRAGSTSCDISPRDTSSPSPPSRLSSIIKQRAPSTGTDPTSRLDDLKPQKDDISTSYFGTSLNPLNSSTNGILHSVDLAVDPEYENDLTMDPKYGHDTKSVLNSPPSLSTLRACRRLQRQLNSQLLCTHAQVKAISELVEEMVSTKSQCNVTTPSLSSRPESGPSYISTPDGLEADDIVLPDPVDDEGYCEGGVEEGEIDTDALMMSLRQASAPLGIRRQAYVNGAVFAKPRMRRKIHRRKRAETRVEAGM